MPSASPGDQRATAGDPAMVRDERDGAVAVITLDRSPVNAYDDAFHIEFQNGFARLKTEVTLAGIRHAEGGAMEKVVFVSVDGHAVMPPERWQEFLEPEFHDHLPEVAKELDVFTKSMTVLNDLTLERQPTCSTRNAPTAQGSGEASGTPTSGSRRWIARASRPSSSSRATSVRPSWASTR